MRELWLKLREDLPLALKDKLLAAAMNSTVVLAGGSDITLARKIGIKTIVSIKGGDMELLPITERKKIKQRIQEGARVAVHAPIRNPEDIGAAVSIATLQPEYIIVSCSDWKVIPLENLVAELHGKCRLLAEVADPEEARLALEALELGVDGIVLESQDPQQLKQTRMIMKQVKTRMEEREKAPRVILDTATVVKTKPVEIGARVCIDTCDLMKQGEGVLVGSQSSGLFLVQAEVEESKLSAPRPFRVNAGPVSSYILIPDGKTKYLSEVVAGSDVLIVDREGRTRRAVVGRAKIEWRPLVLVEAEAEDKLLKILLQNAETVRLVTPDGSNAVTELKPKDRVLVRLETGGRHFGKSVEEESVLEC